MSAYETARNGFAIIGLLVTSGAIGLIGWHAVAAYRRFRANRPARLQQRAMAAAKVISSPDPFGDDSFGDC